MNGYTAICVCLGIATAGFLIYEAMERGYGTKIEAEFDRKAEKGKLECGFMPPSVAATSSDYSLSALPV